MEGYPEGTLGLIHPALRPVWAGPGLAKTANR